MRELRSLVLVAFLTVACTISAKAAAVKQSPGEGGQDSAQAEAIRKRLRTVPSGAIIEVGLRNKQKLQGELLWFETESLTLRSWQGEDVKYQEIKFEDVERVKVLKQKAKAGPRSGSSVGKQILKGLSTAGEIVVGAASDALEKGLAGTH